MGRAVKIVTDEIAVNIQCDIYQKRCLKTFLLEEFAQGEEIKTEYDIPP